ncbi:MAG: ABC transporter ATP-binding protein [Chloroflexi bacterium]|nr:ABC transporter ATP-binding protein [Chloroflexota bacterium]
MKLALRTLPYLRPYRRLLGLSSVILVLDAMVDLANPWVFKILIDHVIGGQPTPPELAALLGPIAQDQGLFLVVIVTAGLVVAIINNGLTVWNSYLQTKIEQGMILRFRSQLFEHAQRLSLTFHDRQRTGDFMYRINYSSAAVGEIPMMVPQLAQAIITLIGMFIVTYLIDPTLALLSMTIAPFLWFSIRRYATHVQPRLEHVRSMEGHSLTMIQEAMSMLRVIISFGRESYEHQRFTEQGRRAVDARVRVTVSQTLFTMAINVITAGGTALVLGYGAFQVIEGRLTLGTLLIVMAYVASVYNPLQAIAGAGGTIQEHLINLKVAFGLLDTEAEIRDAPDAQPLERTQGRVTFKDVSFTYPGRLETLRNVTIDVEPGQVVAIVGPTGAGKTTLMSLLPRFYDPQDGRILLDGIDIRKITVKSLRQHFSVVLQEPLLFSASIAENIRYGRLDASMEEVVAAAEAANSHEFISGLPDGYETILGERGSRLSGGERQRVAVARAFLKDAPILILDEPTSSVDSRTEGVILDALDRLMVGRTTFMIAHRLSTVRHADLIVVLDHGRVVEQGDHETLIVQSGLYHKMHDAQVRQRAAREGRRPRVTPLP